MKVKDYKDLTVWQKGLEIIDTIYILTGRFPKSEIYGICSQMRRAAISIPSNIAEGFVRKNFKEYRQHLYIALGSCAELDTQLIVCKRQKFITIEDSEIILDFVNHEMRMLRNLIISLESNRSVIQKDSI